MYSENKWKRNLPTMSSLIDFRNNWEKFYYQSNNTGENENNKEILKKFNLD